MLSTKEKIKVTIETPDGHTQILECHGFSGVALTDKGETLNCGLMLVGCLNLVELECIRDTLENSLVPHVAKTMLDCIKGKVPTTQGGKHS